MGLIDRLKDAVTPDEPGTDNAMPAHPEASGPAAASGETGLPTPSAPSTGGQVSESGSSFDSSQAANGGADAVPDTPDGVSENYT